jgi:FKBP-type peptidyl-prolyl cis-trans isomerase FkpA
MQVLSSSPRRTLTLLALALLLGGCRDSSTGPIPPADLTFAPELGVNLSGMVRLGSGVYYQDEVVGSGEIAAFSSRLRVTYVGWLHTGQEFDRTTESGGPMSFRLGVGQVIAGWDLGIEGMRVGGRRLLVIPSTLAYGSRPQGSIPPHSTLVFRVELVAIDP